MVVLPQLAKMTGKNLEKVQSLEKELGVVLIGYQPLEFADLSTIQVKELQRVEKDIGATVIAYR